MNRMRALKQTGIGVPPEHLKYARVCMHVYVFYVHTGVS